jgi:hypothetical protein
MPERHSPNKNSTERSRPTIEIVAAHELLRRNTQSHNGELGKIIFSQIGERSPGSIGEDLANAVRAGRDLAEATAWRDGLIYTQEKDYAGPLVEIEDDVAKMIAQKGDLVTKKRVLRTRGEIGIAHALIDRVIDEKVEDSYQFPDLMQEYRLGIGGFGAEGLHDDIRAWTTLAHVKGWQDGLGFVLKEDTNNDLTNLFTRQKNLQNH